MKKTAYYSIVALTALALLAPASTIFAEEEGDWKDMKQESKRMKLDETAEEALQALFAEKERAEVTLHSITDSVITVDVEGRVQFINPAAEVLLATSNEEAHGALYNELINIVDETSTGVEKNLLQECFENLTFQQVQYLLNHHQQSQLFYTLYYLVHAFQGCLNLVCGTCP